MSMISEYVIFSAEISPNEEDSSMTFEIVKPFITSSEIGVGDILIRIDQNQPEIIDTTVYIPFDNMPVTSVHSISFVQTSVKGSNAVKSFLAKVKDGSQRLILRFGDHTGQMSLHNGRVSAAIEDFLNRTQDLPAFYIQDRPFEDLGWRSTLHVTPLEQTPGSLAG